MGCHDMWCMTNDTTWHVMAYDLAWHMTYDMTRHDMTCDCIWHGMAYINMTSPDIWHMTYDMKWHHMTWHHMIWHVMTLHDITLPNVAVSSLFVEENERNHESRPTVRKSSKIQKFGNSHHSRNGQKTCLSYSNPVPNPRSPLDNPSPGAILKGHSKQNNNKKTTTSRSLVTPAIRKLTIGFW